MAKKKQRKAVAIARSEVQFKGSNVFILVRESYRLIKIRLANVHDFIELTLKDGSKKNVSKSVIKSHNPVV